jgi:8-oxo-dGTP pyrophosphatase MutT (NUDIX family)
MIEPSGPEKITYQGKLIEVVEQKLSIGDKQILREFARRSPGTRLIIPTKDGKILLTKEFRFELQGYDIRLPGGKMLDTLEEYNAFLKSGQDLAEKAREAARKEAREEVGIVVKDIEFFGISRCGTSVEWDLYYFVVKAYDKGETALELGEDITALPTDVKEVKNMCLDGRIQEERSALMLLRYLNK